MKLSRRSFLYAAGIGVGALAAPGVGGLMTSHTGVETSTPRGESLWTSEIPPLPPVSPLENDRAVDLAIVGSGYTGLACAYYAKRMRPDWSVIVLESHRLGSGASSRNSGAVSTAYRGVGTNGMTLRGYERLMRFIEEEEIECDFTRGGVIELYPSSRQAERVRSSLSSGQKWISASELEEGMHTPFYAGAVENEEYSTLHPAKLVAGHVRAAQRLGVDLFENSPVVEVKGGKPAELVTPKARVRANYVFIATNAHTPRLGLLKYVMMPVHQYTFATRRLTEEEIKIYGVDRWNMRFERSVLPVTTHVTPSGHFFIRIVLGYAGHNSCEWKGIGRARNRAAEMFRRRYPWISDVELTHGWHGVTGHTLLGREIACPVLGENVHVSAAYNGLGVMPGHNNGYLTACRITGQPEPDISLLSGASGHIPIPGEFYRSLIFKPFMAVAAPA